jgi:hypothetical protein
MASRFNLLLWVALGLHLVGMAILATESLPPAAARAADVAPLPDGWTFPAGCLSW